MIGANEKGEGAGGAPGMRLELLPAADLDAIHAETLKVLEETGVFVEDDEALDIFADGGAQVDREAHLARFPGELVEAAIAACPRDDGGPTTFSRLDDPGNRRRGFPVDR